VQVLVAQSFTGCTASQFNNPATAQLYNQSVIQAVIASTGNVLTTQDFVGMVASSTGASRRTLVDEQKQQTKEFTSSTTTTTTSMSVSYTVSTTNPCVSVSGLSSGLSTSITSGAFNQYLNHYASINGASGLIHANSTGSSTQSEIPVMTPVACPTPQPSSPSAAGLDSANTSAKKLAGTLAGAVVGSIFGCCVIAGGLWWYYQRNRKNAVAYKEYDIETESEHEAAKHTQYTSRQSIVIQDFTSVYDLPAPGDFTDPYVATRHPPAANAAPTLPSSSSSPLWESHSAVASASGAIPAVPVAIVGGTHNPMVSAQGFGDHRQFGGSASISDSNL
jgi:hypothetical protein